MAEPEDFLTRWSRRKRQIQNEERLDDKVSGPPEATAETAQQLPATPKAADTAEKTDVFDLSKLPSLDSIGPDTDIRSFLQPGVPTALSRAALRRAWAADPAIRDFVGLSENAWDFTAPDGVPGFGALDPADAKRLLAQVFGGEDRKESEATLATAEPDAGSDATNAATEAAEGPVPEAADTDNPDCREIAQDNGELSSAEHGDDATMHVDVATQQVAPHDLPRPMRRRGRALPQ